MKKYLCYQLNSYALNDSVSLGVLITNEIGQFGYMMASLMHLGQDESRPNPSNDPCKANGGLTWLT